MIRRRGLGKPYVARIASELSTPQRANDGITIGRNLFGPYVATVSYHGGLLARDTPESQHLLAPMMRARV